MRPRRSMLFIPGANAAMLSTSFVYGADAVMFDLEDAVALREKDTARLLVHHALQHPFYQDVEKVVRINPLNTPFGLADLEAVVRGGADIVRLPKTDSKNDVLELEAQVERIERECGREVGSTRLMAAIESAKGLGFNGKSLVNPRQIELLHQAYSPTRKEVEHAYEVIAAAEEAESRGLGVVSLNGKMIDGPIIDHARKVVALSASGIRD
ncbi:hypothetical protein EDY93_14715 [Salmonella enterica]|nr:hypothetical protein [Salmonella enterica]